MDHRNLDAWTKSITLVKKVYELAHSMPDSEKFGLTNQMKRASISIPSNIAEGAARESDQEFIKFLYYSVGSTTELETQLIISEELEYLQIPDELDEYIQETKQVLLGLIRYLKSKKKPKS
ncbi:MAG: four helix bundle protein [Bacteroidales bacterium]|nr:four helix bundle protein [Bacteroidales bacterium]